MKMPAHHAGCEATAGLQPQRDRAPRREDSPHTLQPLMPNGACGLL